MKSIGVLLLLGSMGMLVIGDCFPPLTLILLGCGLIAFSMFSSQVRRK